MLTFLIEMEGYRARVERDREGMLHARVIEIEEVIYFKAQSVRLVERKFATALAAYFERCDQMGVDPEKPAPAAF